VGTAAAKPEKRKVALQMLRKIMPESRIPEFLAGRFPQRIEFQNHKSLYRKWDFSSEQIFKLVQTGAAGIWDRPELPVIIHPMEVVDSAGKDRMIVNGRCLNLFLEQLPFRYERLRDILAFTSQESFLATWDLKSRYFHVPIHKDYWKYFCFKVGSIIFYFKVLCFGLSQACYVFTKVMQEPAIELRKRGIPLSDYIDDTFTSARTRNRCLRQSSISALFFGSLGAFFGIPKCNLWPKQVLSWLGFIIDSQRQQFKVSDSKIQKLKQALEEMINRPTTSPRKLAALAGKILSISPAVLPAALYSRTFYDALHGKQSWDQVFATPGDVKQAAQFWMDHTDGYNGRDWWPKPVGVSASVDASGVGFGGTLRVREREPIPFWGTFSEAQTAESSTAREVRGYAAALSVVAQHFPDEIRGAAVSLEGDNQGAISALNHFRSPNPGINQTLREVFHLCCDNNFDVVARWIPREDLSEADELSRRPDPSDWGLAKAEAERAFSHFGIRPTIDLFASDIHHVVDRFVSHFYTPDCFAIDAFHQDWGRLIGPYGIAWIFPPLRFVSSALSLLGACQKEALVCLPIKSGSNELIQLHQLEGASISAPYVIPRDSGSCISSCRVPLASLNPAFLGLGVIQVHWN
jgi:hypothetical protein